MDKLTKSLYEFGLESEVDEKFGSSRPSNERFDALQYDFFGNSASIEEELGGLEDEDNGIQDDGIEDGDDEAIQRSSEREEAGHLDIGLEGGLPDFDNSFPNEPWLSSHSSQETRHSSALESEASFSTREGRGWPPEAEALWSEEWEGHKQWPQHQVIGSEGRVPQRSYYPQQQQQWPVVEQALPPHIPYSMVGSFSSPRPRVLRGQASQQHIRSVAPPPPYGHIANNFNPHFNNMPSQPNPPFMGNTAMPPMMSFHGGIPEYSSPSHHMNASSVPQGGGWLPHSNVRPGTRGLMQQQMSQQVMPHHQRLPPGHSGMPPSLNIRAPSQHLYNPPPSSPSLISRAPPNHIAGGEPIDHRTDMQQRGRQMKHFQLASVDANRTRQHAGSKYMTADEIESIARIQLAATHSSDPYVDDYYHQAVQAKITGGTPHGRRHFAPTVLRELPSHARAAAEPHAFLQIDALGRVSFSSIRRPRPLLEVDSSSTPLGGAGDSLIDMKSSDRPLEQEPMLAARIAIEDGFCLLFDVDDIDRFLAGANGSADGGAQLRQRRQILLEGLAQSFHLVDPLAPTAGGNGLLPKDDVIFMRLLSLPKGRKLLARYLSLLFPGNDLARVVCMAVIRHLRFLFGNHPTDGNAPATAILARAVSACVAGMDLPALSACLAAVVLSSEQPPLRPLGSPLGDGATLILRSILDRSTDLLTDQTSARFSMQHRTLWQASFNQFFGLLTKYCTNKYDSIIHSLMMSSSPANPAVISSAAADAMSKELPIELLRSSLPHTNEHQRKVLLEFAQRSMVKGGLSTHSGSNSHTNTAVAAG